MDTLVAEGSQFPASHWLALCVVVVAVSISLLVMFGQLVPRWVYRQVVAERDRWRDDAHSCSHAVALSQAQQQQLLDRINELQRGTRQ